MRDKLPPRDLVVRRLYAGDKEDVCDHFLRLDARARRARFCGVIGDSGVSQYARDVFGPGSIACGAFVEGRLIGLAELHGLLRSWPLTAEAAFSVEPKWQDNGVGDALFERMFAIAQNRGVKTLQMMCLKENRRMQHLASKHHAQLSANQDVVAATLHKHWQTPSSIVEEIVGEITGRSHMFLW